LKIIRFFFLLLLISLSACQPAPASSPGLKVIAVETFLGDIAQNVAGDRARVETLIPIGVDPHAFEPAPQDVARLAEASLIIANGAGFETWLQRTLTNAGGKASLVEASAGLTPRTAPPGEGLAAGDTDPHFWLDPNAVITYVENIRAALTRADPAGAQAYAANAAAYTARLQDLDAWIVAQVAALPPARRLLVTNHEDFGYFADRYGFRIAGAVIPSVSSDASPSPRQLAALVDSIRASGAPAIFLEAGANPQLADQVGRETGVRVVTGLYTHSLTPPTGDAPTYIDMLKYDVTAIVNALK
jgi:ABC-type Zn uptake system ZnuABC Zn-binding protein ZnuA